MAPCPEPRAEICQCCSSPGGEQRNRVDSVHILVSEIKVKRRKSSKDKKKKKKQPKPSPRVVASRFLLAGTAWMVGNKTQSRATVAQPWLGWKGGIKPCRETPPPLPSRRGSPQLSAALLLPSAARPRRRAPTICRRADAQTPK